MFLRYVKSETFLKVGSALLFNKFCDLFISSISIKMFKISNNYKIIKIYRSLTNSVSLSRLNRGLCTKSHDVDSEKRKIIT